MIIKKITVFTLLASLIATIPNQDTFAQRRKRNPGNEKETTVKKDNYQIAIILPYENSAKQGTNSSINFYEGVKLGLIDLDKEGIKLTVKADVLDQTKALSFDNFAYLRELKSYDLIISPISGNMITEIANYAEANKINFISALSPFNGNNEPNNYFHILQPTLKTNIVNMVQYMKSSFPKNKKIILYSNKDAQNYDYIKEALKTDKNVVNYDLDAVKLTTQNLIKQLNPNETTVIYLTSINPKQTEEILQVIEKIPEQYQVEIIGMPTLGSNPRIKNKGAQNISYYYTSAFYFDNNTAFIKKINQMYQDAYQKPANDMVYRGYETILWYARVLNKYGNKFQFSRYDNMDSPYTPFIIKEERNDNNFTKYYENKYLFINKYNSGILHIIEQ